MRAIKVVICLGLVFAVSLLLVFSSPGARSAEKENYCFSCHTNAQKLIKITREITKLNKGKPGGSTETEGEG
jgi:nitrate/TMAO reductase-like tetraheme cytochrome c subunit